MRKGFTLIEVIVSAGIIAIVALGLLQVHSSNTKLISTMNAKYQSQEVFSLVLLNADKKWHGSTKNIYDMLPKQFNLSDSLKTTLKKEKFLYEDDEYSKIELLSKEVKEFASSLGNVDIDNLPEIKLIVDKISLSSKATNAYGYRVSLE